ncbi:DUF1127 domain-containing protein [Inquilinus limosus]|uniref:DUF1127 domain-containing protein n=1 Tax=Inquilinus limosus TaxID=171674 RepID=UPI003F188BAB
MRSLPATTARPRVDRRRSLARSLMHLAARWLRRSRTRRQLWTLSDHELRDLGLERYAADREALKPFWKG